LSTLSKANPRGEVLCKLRFMRYRRTILRIPRTAQTRYEQRCNHLEEHVKNSEWLKKNRDALQSELLKYRKVKKVLES
jgi:hypothetical protein